ncbi:MAG: CapA family protein, partial [Candidatus Paceibacterota bacterium]
MRFILSLLLLLLLNNHITPTQADLIPKENHNQLPSLITLSFSGDILTHKALYDKARTKTGYNFTPLLKELTPFLKNDVDICHLETPITYGVPRSYPVFATPHQIVKAIKDVGFEGCS